MIVGFTGMPGTGKTAGLAWIGLQESRKGRRVLANFKATYAEIWNPFEPPPPDDDGFLLLIHEAGVLLDSRNSASHMNQCFTRWLAQVRKIGADLLWDAQMAGQPDLRLRRFTDLWFQTTWPPSAVKQTGQAGYYCLGRQMVLPISEAFPYYNTRESVDYESMNRDFSAKMKVLRKRKEKQLENELPDLPENE